MARLSFGSILLKILKVFGITILVILLLFGIASWYIFEKKNDLLLDEMQRFARESQSGQLEVSGIDLKLFRSFPDVTVQLNGIKYYEHVDTVRIADELPILTADHIFVAFELLPLLDDELKISRVSLTSAKLDIVEYANGKLNLELALAPPARPKPQPTPADTAKKKAPAPKPAKDNQPKPAPPAPHESHLNFNLDFLSFKDLSLTWRSKDKSPPTVIVVDELNAELASKNGVLEVELSTTSEIQSMHHGRIAVPPGTLSLDGHVLFDVKNKLLTILESDVKYDEFKATISGKFDYQTVSRIDMEFDASSNDLELLSLVIKPEVLRQNPDLLKRGDIYIRGHVAGALKSPELDVSFGMNDLALQLPRNLGKFDDVAFEGRFTSGALPKYAGATLNINKISGQMSGGFIKGKFSIQNFVDPYIKYDLEAQVKLDGLDQVFHLPAIRDLKGSAQVHANFDGKLKLFDQHQSDSTRSSTISLDSLSFIVAKTNQRVSGLSVVMENKNNRATLNNFRFKYGRNNLAINATIDNFVYLLFRRSAEVVATGNIKSSQLFTSDFIVDTTATADIQDRISNLSIDFAIKTSDLDSVSSRIPDLDFTIQNLTATFDRLPDIKSVDAKGLFRETENGFRLDLNEFHATMPQGKLDVKGDLTFPRRRYLEFNAKVQADKFPITYVDELIEEIKSHGAKKPDKGLDKLDVITANLDLSAGIITRPFALTKVIIRDSKAQVQLANKKTYSAEKLNLNCTDLSLNYATKSGVPGLRSTAGTISMTKLSIPTLEAMDLDLAITGKSDSLSIGFSRGVPETKLEEGNLFVDFSKPERNYRLHYIVKGAKLENYIKKFHKQKLMQGEVDYELDLVASGSSFDSLKKSVAGTIEINGDSLDLYGVDVDKILKKFERSQHFNLTDLGAVLVAGPVGLAVTKGTDFVSLAAVDLKPGHYTYIQSLRTRWKLNDLLLTTDDVAFATRQNRIAVIGSIDLANDSIPGLTIAVIDKNGCALMEQPLYGKMTDLKTGELKIARTLFGSVINFVNKVVGKDCKPVYAGSVAAPVSD